MDFIRTERINEAYDANTRHCMYGLDADLVRFVLFFFIKLLFSRLCLEFAPTSRILVCCERKSNLAVSQDP